MSAKKDLTGQRFGRLVVLGEAPRQQNSPYSQWVCQCDCGNKTIVRGSSLTYGSTKSCGCLRDEIAKKPRKHGGSRTRLYYIFQGMKTRCTSEKDPHYPNYGGRGIFVCDEWLQSFEAFQDWALANGYRDDLSIDRIDNDGPYCPENCRWVDMVTQAKNRRNHRGPTKAVRCVETGEIFKSMAAAAQKVGANRAAIWSAANSNAKAAGFHWEYA